MSLFWLTGSVRQIYPEPVPVYQALFYQKHLPTSNRLVSFCTLKCRIDICYVTSIVKENEASPSPDTLSLSVVLTVEQPNSVVVS